MPCRPNTWPDLESLELKRGVVPPATCSASESNCQVWRGPPGLRPQTSASPSRTMPKAPVLAELGPLEAVGQVSARAPSDFGSPPGSQCVWGCGAP